MIVHVFISILPKITGIGIIIVISTSKIKKITAIKKKCNENGTRASDFGSYPHSNGDPFSRSACFFIEINEFKIIRITGKIILNNTIANIMFSHKDFLIGS